MAVGPIGVLVAEFAPAAVPILTSLAEAALVALGLVAAAWTGRELGQMIRASIDTNTIIRSALADKATQTQFGITYVAALAWAAQMAHDYRAQLERYAWAYLDTKFDSYDQLTTAYWPLIKEMDAQGVSRPTFAQLWSHTEAEMTRLGVPKTDVVTPAVPTVPAAPAVPAETPLWSAGQIIQTPDGKQYRLDKVIPGPPVVYQAVYLGTGASLTLAQTTMKQIGATVLGQPIAPTIPGAAAPAVPGAAAVPAAAIPGISAGDWTQILTGALPLVGAGVGTNILANALGIGQGLHQGRLTCQQTSAQVMLQQLLGAAAPLGAMALLETGPIRDKFTDPLTHWLFDELLTIPEQGKPITPEQAPELARRLLERAIGLGISAHLASVAAEANAPLKTMGLGYLSAFMADMAGFSRIAGATMGVLETRALAVPMGYYINSKVKTQLPDARALAGLAGEYHLVPEELRRQLAATDPGLDEIDRLNHEAFDHWSQYHGWPDFWLPYLYDATHRGAGDRLLRFMANQGIWDPTYYRTELLHSGYELETVRRSLDMLYSLAHAELKTVGVGDCMKRYREGLDDQAELSDNLQLLGVNPQLLGKYLYVADLQADYDDYTDELAALQNAVRKYLLTPEEMEAQLVQRLHRTEKAALLADKERIRLIPKAAPSQG